MLLSRACVWHLLSGVSDCFCEQEQLCLFTRKEKKRRREGETRAEGGVEKQRVLLHVNQAQPDFCILQLCNEGVVLLLLLCDSACAWEKNRDCRKSKEKSGGGCSSRWTMGTRLTILCVCVCVNMCFSSISWLLHLVLICLQMFGCFCILLHVCLWLCECVFDTERKRLNIKVQF